MTIVKFMLIYTIFVGSQEVTRVEYFDTESQCVEESQAIGPLVESADCWTVTFTGEEE